MSTQNSKIVDRQSFIQSLHDKLDKVDKELAELEAKMDTIELEARLKYQQQIDSLKARRRAYEQRIKQVEESTGNAWEDMRQGMGQAWQEMTDAFNRAQQEFEDAPQKTRSTV